MAKLPIRSLGVYCPYWDSPSLSSLPPQYNTFYLFSARPVGGTPGSTGAVFYEPHGEMSELVTNVTTLRDQGKCVILSVGGAGEYLSLSTRGRTQSFVDSVKRINETVVSVDGIDWDIENGSLYPKEMEWASKQLKSAYGDDFAITYTAAPWKAEDRGAVMLLHVNGVLDMVSPQYYDLTGLHTEQERINHAVNNLESSWAPLVSGDYSKLGFGFANVGLSTAVMDVSSCAAVWSAVATSRPSVRGAFVWEAALDASIDYAFAKTLGPLVLSVQLPEPAPLYYFYGCRLGDSLSSIARRVGVKWEKIASLNSLTSPYVIRAGQKLKIPIS